MSNAALLATRYARRPLLLEPSAATEILHHLEASDPRGMVRESRFSAVLRKIGLGAARPQAMDQEDSSATEAPRRPMAYSPLWAQQTYGDPTDEGFAWSLYGGAALMEIDTALSERGEYFCGTWYHGYDTVLAAMREACADSRVGGLFVRMSCPGGVGSGGILALAAFMRSARATGNVNGKPIHVYADMACSAAYWIAAQADRISASKLGLVGSVGAVLVHQDVSGALAKAGVVVTPIQFGAEKTSGASFAPLTASARADLQAEIDELGQDFVADVVVGRPKLTAEALLATEARVFLADARDPARSGLALGFVDAIETEEEAFAALLAVIQPTAAVPAAAAPLKLVASAPREAPKAALEAAMPTRSEVLARVEARATRMRAEMAESGDVEVEAPCPDCGGTGQVDGHACATCDGDGQIDEADAPGPDDTLETDQAAPEAAAAAERQRIAAIRTSAEAETHPHMALAAISDGLSLDQFQSMVAGASKSGKGGQLDRLMSGARRLGPDTAGSGQPSPGSALVADAKKKAEAARR